MKKIKHFKPLHHSLTIAESKIDGLGIIAKNNIDKGVNLGISHVKHEGYSDGLIRTPLGGYLNHSDNPNAIYSISTNDFRVITSRPIKKGEEITVSYRNFYDKDVLDSFN